MSWRDWAVWVAAGMIAAFGIASVFGPVTEWCRLWDKQTCLRPG